jgi:hypothetical protein
LRDRLRAPILAGLVAGSVVLSALPAATNAAGYKVAVIVGPTGAQTSAYRSYADDVVAAATARGATVVKVYSPNATWANVKAAVNGANIIVWMGHGNGWPNPYTSPPNSLSSTEPTDRDNGWGLNRTTTNGDGDNWSTTMVYCGEKALLGTLTSASTAQWAYCGGSTNTDGIHPAPGFVMIYAHACYTPGAGEVRPASSETIAKARVANYSYPVLKLGASAYFATDYGDEDALVGRLLDNPTMGYSSVFRAGVGYSAAALKSSAHPDISGMSVYIQKTMHGDGADYWYAFAGRTTGTLSGATAPAPPQVVSRYPGPNSTNAGTTTAVTATFDQAVSGVSGSTFSLRTAAGQAVASDVTYNAYWRRAELRPSAELLPGTKYTATIGTGISGATGPVDAQSWSFTTAGTPPLGDGEANYDPPVRLTFRQGTHTGYQFTTTGTMTVERTITLATDSGANTSMLRALPNQSGRWFYLVNGAWAGYWIRQSAAVSLAGSVSAMSSDTDYDPPARVIFNVGTHTGYRFSSSGALLGARTVTLASDSGADASSRATLTNQFGSWFSIVNGAWAGYWIRESDVVHLP